MGASSPFQYFADHEDPALAGSVREGRRREFAAFGWQPEDLPDPQATETFERCRRDWRELGEPGHADLLAWHRDLIALRRATPALVDGRPGTMAVGGTEEEPWLVVRRGPIAVVCNLAKRTQRVPLSLTPGAVMRLAAAAGVELRPDAQEVPAETVAILHDPGAA